MQRALAVGLVMIWAGMATAQEAPPEPPMDLGRMAEIVAARYEMPTTRYAHGVLGDRVEYGALAITEKGGKTSRFVLPDARVFEDIAPRLWDVTGDGKAEVVVVEAHQDLGARLAVWTAQGRVATTPHIGTRFRWLAPVGAADLDGDGAMEIAFVDRPHLAKTLRVWRYANGRLREVGRLRGVSNLQIGWDYIIGGLRNCADGPEMVLASGDWRRLLAIRFDGSLMPRDIGRYDAARLKAAMACR